MFETYLDRWRLDPDGEPITSPTSRLLPVLHHGVPAMLKVATEPEERRGADTMTWWDGDGAAHVLAHEGDALLMERAEGSTSLEKMARSDRDDEATRIMCQVAAKLHAPRMRPLPSSLVPLPEWFAALEPGAMRHGGILEQAAATARHLFAEPRDIVVLHGDIHHGNILDFRSRGWLAIDPKGLYGDPGYEVGTFMLNRLPEGAPPSALAEIMRGRLAIFSEELRIARERLAAWAFCHAVLSALWSFEEADAWRPTLRRARLLERLL